MGGIGETIIVIMVLLVFFIIIYSRLKDQSLNDTISEIKEVFKPTEVIQP